MVDEYVITDLSTLDTNGLKEARDLLDAWLSEGLPLDFEDSGVYLATDAAGEVYLSNDDEQKAAMYHGGLEMIYNCSCGQEGFADEIGWNIKTASCNSCEDIEEDEIDLEDLPGLTSQPTDRLMLAEIDSFLFGTNRARSNKRKRGRQ